MDRSYLPITRFGIEQSDGVTAISKYLRDKTLTDFAIQRPIEAIPNFVNCDLYMPLEPAARAAGRAAYASPGEPLLIHLSNFRPVKRVIDVIQVFARIARELPAHLLLVGDGPDRSQAEMLASQLGIRESIHFLGKQDSVSELLPLADLMLMPSELESFGLAALEAMACRVPAIATRVGGVPELIDDGINGFLFSVGEVDAMAQRAIALLRDPARLEQVGAAARQTAQDRFCASRIIPLYERYYEQVVAQAPR